MLKMQTNKTIKTLPDYELGQTLAKKWFNYYLETGRCNPGGAESIIYCEVIAGEIRDNKLITESKLATIIALKTQKNTPFYDGLCDFLLEKIKESSDDK